MTVRLRDVASVIRSKNAGPFELTLDVLLKDRSAPIWSLVRPGEAERITSGEMDWPWYGQLMGTPQTIAYLCQIDHWLRRYNVDLLI